MIGRFPKVTQVSGGCCRVKFPSIRVWSMTQICSSRYGAVLVQRHPQRGAGEDPEGSPTSDGATFKLMQTLAASENDGRLMPPKRM